MPAEVDERVLRSKYRAGAPTFFYLLTATPRPDLQPDKQDGARGREMAQKPVTLAAGDAIWIRRETWVVALHAG